MYKLSLKQQQHNCLFLSRHVCILLSILIATRFVGVFSAGSAGTVPGKGSGDGAESSSSSSRPITKVGKPETEKEALIYRAGQAWGSAVQAAEALKACRMSET